MSRANALLIAGAFALVAGTVYYVQHKSAPPTVPVTPITNPGSSGGASPAPDPGATTQPPASAQGPALGVVLAASLPVRAEPKSEASITGTLFCGDVVWLEAEAGGWARVRLEEVSGWAHQSYVVKVGASGFTPNCEMMQHPPGTDPDAERPIARTPRRSNLKPPPDLQVANTGRITVTPPATIPAPRPGPDENPPPRPGPDENPPPQPGPRDQKPPRDSGEGPAVILLSNKGVPKTITFPHHVHNTMLDCGKCHHPVDGAVAKKAGTDERCRACHVQDGKGISPVSNKNAFHNTCRDCHKAMGAGPQRCASCHGGDTL